MDVVDPKAGELVWPNKEDDEPKAEPPDPKADEVELPKAVPAPKAEVPEVLEPNKELPDFSVGKEEEEEEELKLKLGGAILKEAAPAEGAGAESEDPEGLEGLTFAFDFDF